MTPAFGLFKIRTKQHGSGGVAQGEKPDANEAASVPFCPNGARAGAVVNRVSTAGLGVRRVIKHRPLLECR